MALHPKRYTFCNHTIVKEKHFGKLCKGKNFAKFSILFCNYLCDSELTFFNTQKVFQNEQLAYNYCIFVPLKFANNNK